MLLGKCGCEFKCVNFKHNIRIEIWCIQVKITVEWMPGNLGGGRSTLDHVMAWCCHATSHYPNQFDQDLRPHMASLVHSELINDYVKAMKPREPTWM